MLAAGALTQLEWVDLCANALMLDGVDFDAAHFPRTDDDYLAQLKKLCVDRCLTVAAISDGTQFGSGSVDDDIAHLRHWTDVAAALGAPLVRFACGAPEGSPVIAWRELIRGLKAACVHAKQRNTTLALEPRDGTLVTTPLDAKRALKEGDSAWLRLAPTCAHLVAPNADEWANLVSEAIIVAAPLRRLDTFGADEAVNYRDALTMLWQQHYRGFLSVEYGGTDAEAEAVSRAVARLRAMLAKEFIL